MQVQVRHLRLQESHLGHLLQRMTNRHLCILSWADANALVKVRVSCVRLNEIFLQPLWLKKDVICYQVTMSCKHIYFTFKQKPCIKHVMTLQVYLVNAPLGGYLSPLRYALNHLVQNNLTERKNS